MTTNKREPLTEQEKRNYVLKGGFECPYCGSNNLESQRNPQTDGPDAWQKVSCLSCNRRWRDYYALNDIIEME